MTKELHLGGLHISGVVGLTPQTTDQISGYLNVAPLAHEIGIAPTLVESYSLVKECDRAAMENLDIDVLLVLGWQRIVPTWLIDLCRIGAIGVHGSASGISRGRGRSPQNWAILMGKSSFQLSVYFIDSGIDSGDIIASREIPLSDRDDIKSCHYKVSRAAVEMIKIGFRDGSIVGRVATPQVGPFRYLPQRLPKDGAIDWNRSTVEIDRFVRALTRPYPGAFSGRTSGETVKIWRARPFNIQEDFNAFCPGRVIATFECGCCLIRTGDGALLVDEYESTTPLLRDQSLISVDFVEQLRRLTDRHRANHPQLPVSDDIRFLEARDR